MRQSKHASIPLHASHSAFVPPSAPVGGKALSTRKTLHNAVFWNAAASLSCEALSSLKEKCNPCDRDHRGRPCRAHLRVCGPLLSARLAQPGALHTPSRVRLLASHDGLAGTAVAGSRRLPDRRRHVGVVRAALVPSRSCGRITVAADTRRLADLRRERPALGTRTDRLAVATLVESVRPELKDRDGWQSGQMRRVANPLGALRGAPMVRIHHRPLGARA